jgi:SAM-dependent methyltransferase
MESLFDSDLVRQRRLRAAREAEPGADFLMRHVCDDLADRLSAVERRFAVAADLFSGSAVPARTLAESGKVGEVVRVETDRELLGGETGLLAPPETLPLEPESIDLAVSLLSLQETNDIPGMLIQTRRALKPDGLFLGAMAGQGTLAELKESLLAAETELSGGASPRVAPFADVREAGALLQRAGLALPVADVEQLTVRYDSMFHLTRPARHGRGQCAVGPLAPPGHARLLRAGGGNLRGALFRSGRARARHLLDHMDVGLGAARLAAAAAQAGQREGLAGKHPFRSRQERAQ